MIDLVRGCEMPHENRLDCITIDLALLVVEIPIPVLLVLVLWPLYRFAPPAAFWQAPIWTACGFCAGYAASCLFFYAVALIYRLRPAFPLPVFTWGTIAGTVGFTFAFALRYRGVRRLTMRWSQRLTGAKFDFE